MNTIDAAELLRGLQTNHVKLWVADGRLHYTGPDDALAPDVVRQLQVVESEVMQLVVAEAIDASKPTVNQRAFHLAHTIDPQGWRQHNVLAYEVKPALAPQLVKAAFDQVIERHEALRMTFHEDERGLRCLHRPITDRYFRDIPLAPHQDLRAEAVRVAHEPFDVSEGPLLRVCLLSQEGRSVLVFAMHHLISDGYSLFVMLRELKYFYACLVEDRRPALPSPLGKFQAHLAAEQGLEATGDGARLLELCRHHIRPEVSSTRLPFASNVASDGDRQGSHLCHLTPELSQRVTQLARDVGVSVFTAFTAALGALLFRIVERSDIALGIPMLNRSRVDCSDCIGFFANNAVLQSTLSEAMTFRELLHATQAAMTHALEREGYPFPLVVKHLNPRREAGRNPFFDIALDSLMFPPEPLLEEAFDRRYTLTDLAVPQGIGDLDLLIWVQEDARRYRLTLRYNAQVLGAESIQILARCLVALLEDAVARPDATVADLELLSPAAKHTMLCEWNATDAPFASASIASLVQARLQQDAGAPAVRFHDEAISYGELYRRARAVAQLLVDHGVRPRDRIGVCLHRSIDVIPTILGIWHAGAVHVPIDPALPPARRQRIVELSRLATWFVDDDATDRGGPPAIAARELRRAIVSGPLAAESPTGAAEDLAYIIFTSGSTGEPKGVRVTHRSLCNFAAAMIPVLRYGPSEVSVAVVSISFDVFFTDMVCALVSGGEIVFVDDETTGDGRRLFEAIRRHGATRMMATPSTWSIVAPHLADHGARLRQCMAGGEALPASLVPRLHEVAEEVWNLYGPAEATVWATAKRLERGDDVTIGRPLANTQIYIVDPRGRPTPPEVAGEICIGGAGVADGYEGNAAETAQRFVDNWLDPSRDDKVYRTGDYGYFRADGEIRFLGRRDGQIKIRGYRVELGEIEVALKRHPSVADAVVLRLGEDAHSTLRGYVILRPGHAGDGKALGRFVADILPGYMVPSGFAFVDAFPHNVSRKVDRLALAALPLAPAAAPAAIAPRGGTVAVLAQIWASALARPATEIGLDDNFFDLGGNSLLLNQLQLTMNRQLGLQLRVTDLFKFPTIQLLADHIDGLGVPSSAPATEPSRQRADFLRRRGHNKPQ